MNATTHPTVRDYLQAVDLSLHALPRARREEIVGELREHVDAALAERPGASEADVRTLLARLGTPAAIAAEAYADFPARDRQTAKQEYAHEYWAVGLVTIGNAAFPFAGWAIGAALAATSRVFRTRDKLLTLLALPVGLWSVPPVSSWRRGSALSAGAATVLLLTPAVVAGVLLLRRLREVRALAGPGTERPPRPAFAQEYIAIFFLTAGSLVPYIGWLFGLVLALASRVFRPRHKVLAALVVPFGLWSIEILGQWNSWTVDQGCTFTRAGQQACLAVSERSGPAHAAYLIAMAVCAFGPMVTGVVLARRLRHVYATLEGAQP